MVNARFFSNAYFKFRILWLELNFKVVVHISLKIFFEWQGSLVSILVLLLSFVCSL